MGLSEENAARIESAEARNSLQHHQEHHQREDELLARIGQLQAEIAQQAKWQPIETAPRDGTEILVWAPGSGRWLIKFDGEEPAGRAFTHWQPLPEPPK